MRPSRTTFDRGHINLGPLADLPTVAAEQDTGCGAVQPWNVEAKASPSSPALLELNDMGALRLLQAIVENPGKASSWYPKQAKISPQKAVQARKKLVALKLIRETEVQTQARGRAAIVITPTAEAAAVVCNFSLQQGEQLS